MGSDTFTDADICLGVMGCGGQTQRSHIPSILGLRGIKQVVLFDIVPERLGQTRTLLERLAARNNVGISVRGAESEDELIARSTIVDIVVPPFAQFEVVQRCVAAGRKFLIEKPLIRTWLEAESALALTEDGAVPGQYLETFHFVPLLVAAERHIRAGEIGQLQRLHLDFPNPGPSPYPNGDSWRTDPFSAGGGVLPDWGSHLLGAALRLVGEGYRIGQVQSTKLFRREFVGNGCPRTRTDDLVEGQVLLNDRNGARVLVSICASWRGARAFDPGAIHLVLSAQGTQGELLAHVVNMPAGREGILEISGQVARRLPLGPGSGSANVCSCLSHAIQTVVKGGGNSPWSALRFGADIQLIIAGLYISHLLQSAVSVDEIRARCSELPGKNPKTRSEAFIERFVVEPGDGAL